MNNYHMTGEACKKKKSPILAGDYNNRAVSTELAQCFIEQVLTEIIGLDYAQQSQATG